MSRARARSERGFTLLELMVVCTVIGVLASVAIPSFTHMSDRTKAAERGVMVRSIRNALMSMRVKEGAFAAPAAALTGDWNPALPATTTPRPFRVGAAGWNKLDLVIEGACYYSYQFVGEEAATPYFAINVTGNVDGDAVAFGGSYRWEFDNSSFVQTDAPDPSYEEATF